MLDEVFSLAEDGTDRYLGPPRTGTTLPKTYGGQTIAQALAAACRTVDPERAPVSAHGLYLSAGDTENPAEYAVERVRDGRAMTVRTVAARQGHREHFRLSATFQAEEPGLEHDEAMPSVPAPEDVPSLFDVMDEFSTLDSSNWREEWAFLDPRYVRDGVESPAADHGKQQMWLTLPEVAVDQPWLGRCILAYVSDLTLLSASLLPHGMMLGDPDLPRATVTHSVYFHADPEPGERVFVDQRSSWAGHGLGLSQAAIFSRTGRRLATLVQDGLIRPRSRRMATRR